MKKFINFFVLSLLTSISIFGMSLDFTEERTDSESGIKWRGDQFGNLHPEPTSVASEKLVNALKRFVDDRRETERGHAFLIRIGHEDGRLSKAIHEAGFSYRYGDDRGTEWIINNGSPIPAVGTTTKGARIIPRRKNDKGVVEVLVIEDKFRRGKIRFPGGSVDPQELPEQAACRELEEEVGLKTNKGDLQLVALLSRIRANRYNNSDDCHYYVTDNISGSLEVQEDEVVQALWVPLVDVSKSQEVGGLPVNPLVPLIAQHILSGGKNACHTLPDFRQSSAAKKDLDDTMTFHLFELNEKSGASAS